MNQTFSQRIHAPVITRETPTFAVIDDFLDAQSLSAIRSYCETTNYKYVHSEGIRKVWRVTDGNPLQGLTSYLSAQVFEGTERVSSGKMVSGSIDVCMFLQQLALLDSVVKRVVGTPGEDWVDVTGCPWVYPPGTALSLHRDGHRYSGAYTFFAHKQWNIHWGGALLILEDKSDPSADSNDDPCTLRTPWLDDEAESEQVMKLGLAHCVFPKPNRLVLLSPKANHLMAKVDGSAGQNARLSVAGFFRRSS